MIIYDSKLYKVNENFTATDWSTDRPKLTLISSGGSGGATDAIDVSYDNSKTNLEYISGYDFPKFKTSIPDSISITFTGASSSELKDFNGNIIKSSDGSYLLSMNLNDLYFSGNVSGVLTLKEINGKTNIYEMYSILSQFFDLTSEELIMSESGEINIEGVESVPSFLIFFDSNPSLDTMFIQFYISSNSKIEDGNYNVTLNIKNRVLREEDKNIFALSDPFMGTQKIMDKYIFSLVQKDNNIKLTGSYTLKEGAGVCIGFYSPIIENYLDVYTSSVQIKNTTGITSSSGKPFIKLVLRRLLMVNLLIYYF